MIDIGFWINIPNIYILYISPWEMEICLELQRGIDVYTKENLEYSSIHTLPVKSGIFCHSAVVFRISGINCMGILKRFKW